MSWLKFPLFAVACLTQLVTPSQAIVIQNNDPAIFYHGRWDSSPGSWWAGTGFKLNVRDLTSLTLNLANFTASPAALGVSVDYGPFTTVNVTVGANTIPLDGGSRSGSTVVRVNVEGWQNNRIHLDTITLNDGATLLPYKPSKLAFQFIGDSLSAGQFLDQGVDQAWPFLTGEFFKAEHVVVAQPGAALTDIVSFGNQHGLSFEFFRASLQSLQKLCLLTLLDKSQTEDDGYFFTTDHNFTTPWDFRKDVPAATHVVIHLGANDASQNISDDAFVENYLSSVTHLRTIYQHQPIFVFSPWGWPQPDGPNSQYYQGDYELIVDTLHSHGDSNVFLVNTTGWVDFDDVFPDNMHPTVAGHAKIAGLFESWLQEWGLRPHAQWATPA
ncbi:SGNH hydrolase-type esterase domain-containing protein [Amylostereum chailletii]|nr:SGNH hydrolase-type esterase domain-containing protein [Amylostereum chailletii]